MNNTLIAIISAAGIPVFLFALYGTAESAWAEQVSQSQRQQFRNLFFVLFAAITVIFHLNTTVGINLDIRGSAIAVGLLFGGAGTGLAATLVEGLTRYFWEGDGGWLEELRILVDFLVIWLIWTLVVRKQVVNFRIVALTGMAVGMTDAFSLLWIRPWTVAVTTFHQNGLELFAFNALATIMFGGLLLQQNARLSSSRLLRELNHRLRQQFEQSIESLGSAVMHRDPGTANHQRRVADISVAIARDLALGEDQQQCVALAGLLHDIGQIEIPAEILNRARALTVEEFDLVKTHVDSGVSILQSIDFGCDVTDIVRQHHENVDGSGYPEGLQGDRILPGARIVRVADSLEAMLSHRPFRQAHDLAFALAELEAGAGTLYDPQVIQSCKKLILNKQLPL